MFSDNKRRRRWLHVLSHCAEICSFIFSQRREVFFLHHHHQHLPRVIQSAHAVHRTHDRSVCDDTALKESRTNYRLTQNHDTTHDVVNGWECNWNSNSGKKMKQKLSKHNAQASKRNGNQHKFLWGTVLYTNYIQKINSTFVALSLSCAGTAARFWAVRALHTIYVFLYFSVRFGVEIFRQETILLFGTPRTQRHAVFVFTATTSWNMIFDFICFVCVMTVCWQTSKAKKNSTRL